jgi:chromosomal replication initiation ATPase DnaA
VATVWDDLLAQVRAALDPEDFRRWFASTAYASDAGDQITVWVSSEAIRRHLIAHYQNEIEAALLAIGRERTHVRFLVAGFGDEDEDEDGGH